MPNNEEHAQHTYKLYGIWAHDLHRWIDAPSKTHGQGHRRFRHSPHRPPPLSAIEKYGYSMARKIQLAHFMLDGVHWGLTQELPIWQEGNWIYKRMPNGRTYKKQLNGSPKPRSPQRPKRTTDPQVIRRQATDEEGLEIIKSVLNQAFNPNSTVTSSTTHINGVSISVSVEPQPKPRHSSRFTCPRCEGAVKVKTAGASSSGDYQYPNFCVHCGYDLRGACLVADYRRKEWVR